jgi:hypothetical protein
MLAPSDLIHLAYTPDLTEGGISYACRTLACTSERMGDSPGDYLRRSVADVAVELAFRRYLREHAVPFHVLGAAPFTQPDHYDVALGGHRCIVQSCLITHRSQITQFRHEPGSLLQAPALLPIDECASEEHKPDDLYLFAFLLGLVAASQADIGKAIAAGQPVFLIHMLPEAWARPRSWVPLEKLALKSECESTITMEIGGQDSERNFITAGMELPPRQRMLVEKDFHSIAYIHAKSKPEARIGIRSPLQSEPHLVPTHAWSNLWVYGMDIILTGWLTHEEFYRKVKVLKVGTRALQVDRTGVKNLQVPISELNPLGGLLEKVRKWEEEKKFQPTPSS